MRDKLTAILFLLFSLPYLGNAQIINGLDTLYGNEWINFGQSYFKIMVAEDGIYRIPHQTMADANLPLTQVNGDQLQLFHNGEEVPMFVSTDGQFGADDFIEFFGKKNTVELDRHLFKDPDAEMMNPLYGLITDTAAYFLTWKPVGGNVLRYEPITNDLVNLPPKETYFMAEHVLNYFSSFTKKSNSQNISSSDYGVTEGFSNAFASVQTITVSPLNVYAGGPNGQLYIRYGTNIGQHQQVITLNDQPLITEEFDDFQVRQLDFEVQNSLLSAPLALKFQGLASNNDKQRIANVILRYPSGFNFNNQTQFVFELPTSATVRYLEIENFNAAGGIPLLYDLTHRTRMNAILESGVVKIALPPSNQPVRLMLLNDAAGIKTVAALSSVAFIDYSALNAELVILSNPKLYDDGNGHNYVQDYADYRSSAAGGDYATVIVDVQQVYEQFGWGVNRHPLSIRNFGHYIKKAWPDVKYFFVIGKGREYKNVRTSVELSNTSNATYYVPTFGYPGADNLLLSSNSTSTPVIPIGRIPAASTEDIEIYLRKIKDYESNDDLGQTIEERAWMKNVIHLGGGGNISEQSVIKSYLQDFENTIEGGKFGGKVTALYKNSTDPIQLTQSDEFFTTINQGVSLLTFFGHSAVGTFDFNIDDPTNYDNYKKYPLMFSLGCYSGNFHTSASGVGERFIFFEDRGAIGFAASSGQAFISSLYTLISKTYNLISGDFYDQSIGNILQQSIREFDNGNGLNNLTQQFTYAGDPAVHINFSPGPDYIIDRGSIKFSPTVITAQQEDFTLSFDILNLGRNIPDSMVVEVEMEYPAGQKVKVVNEKILASGFTSHLDFKIPIPGREVVGLNRFYIKIDAVDDIAELPLPAAESNNELDSPVTLFILDNSAIPVYPTKYAIVGSQNVELKASTSNAFASSRKYLLELDTIGSFDSPWKKTTEIIQPGGVIKWKPQVQYIDSMVYYWRISPEPGEDVPDYIWENSSFIYLNNSSPGWNQSHYYQYLESKFDELEFNGNKTLKFTDASFNIRIINRLYGGNPAPAYIYDFSNPAASIKPWNANSKHIAVVVADSINGVAWQNSGSQHGSVNNGTTRVFVYPTSTPTERQTLINFLTNIVPDNNFVFVFTVLGNENADLSIQNWAMDSVDLGVNLFQILEAQGATKFRKLEEYGAVPYTICFQKGVNTLVEDIVENITDVSDINVFIPIHKTEGNLQSSIIGPAKKWETLSWLISGMESAADTTYLTVVGIDAQQNEVLLIDNFTGVDTSLTAVDANQYPYLKLRMFAKDPAHRTPAQLDYWRVKYEGLPEAAVNPLVFYKFDKDSLQQGEILQVGIGVENIGDYQMDSMLVKYSLINENNVENATSLRFKPLAKGDTLVAEFSSHTRFMSGRYQFIAEINPNNDQSELYHFNNFASTQFIVEGDKINPLLDVTFDGKHLLDGDIVPNKPHIAISIRDENPFLYMEDTSEFKLFLIRPGTTEPEEIYFGADNVAFFPANALNKNTAKIEFNPEFKEDGRYRLIVQAADVSGNQSGQYDYAVNFEVITKEMVSNVLNYPNPFSSSTRFLYTVTGLEPPTFFKIQIMTASGRIVRELTQTELGPLKIGNHLTDYAWDGTDEYGDKLANGVYFYQVVVKNKDGKDFDDYDNHRQTNTDKYFKNNIGKLVIIR